MVLRCECEPDFQVAARSVSCARPGGGAVRAGGDALSGCRHYRETKAKLTAPAADSPIEIERAVEAAILPVVQGLRKQNFRGTMDKDIPMKKSRFTGVQMISVLRQAEGGIPFPEP